MSYNKTEQGKTQTLRLLCFLIITLFFIHCGDSASVNPKEVKKFYSLHDFGKWENQVDDHVPRLEVDSYATQFNVLVYVLLKDSSKSHYIEKIGILDDHEKVIHEVSFGPGAQSSFTARFTLYPLPFDISGYKVYAKCNLHDLWIHPWIPEQH